MVIIILTCILYRIAFFTFSFRNTKTATPYQKETRIASWTFGSGKCKTLRLYLGEETLFLLGRQKEAGHAEELQVGGGHLDLPQATVHQVYGQVQSLILEVQQLLGGTDVYPIDYKAKQSHVVMADYHPRLAIKISSTEIAC